MDLGGRKNCTKHWNCLYEPGFGAERSLWLWFLMDVLAKVLSYTVLLWNFSPKKSLCAVCSFVRMGLREPSSREAEVKGDGYPQCLVTHLPSGGQSRRNILLRVGQGFNFPVEQSNFNIYLESCSAFIELLVLGWSQKSVLQLIPVLEHSFS